MKVVVIGGSGLIGKPLVAELRALGHEVVAASPRTGVNTLTGEGLKKALEGSQVVVDVSNSPSFETLAVLEFFETSTRNLLEAARVAGVAHYVALSIVGMEKAPDIGYFQAKLRQEELIKAAGLPYTVVRATQFIEFVGQIAGLAAAGDELVVPDADLQLISAADVSHRLVEVATGAPLNGTTDIAGPERASFAEFVSRYARAHGDPRTVRASADGQYFGAPIVKSALVPDGEAWLGERRFEDWLAAAACN